MLKIFRIFNKYWRIDWVYNHITVPKHKKKLMKDVDYVNWDIVESSVEILFKQFIEFYENCNRYERTKRWHLADRTHNVKDEFKTISRIFIYLLKYLLTFFYNPESNKYHKASRREAIVFDIKRKWKYRCEVLERTKKWNKMSESDQALEVFSTYMKNLLEIKEWSVNHFNAYIESEDIYRYVKFVRHDNMKTYNEALDKIYSSNEDFLSRFEAVLPDKNTKKFDHKFSQLKHKDNKSTFKYTFKHDILEIEFVKNDKPLHFDVEQDMDKLDTEYAKRILDIRGYLWD